MIRRGEQRSGIPEFAFQYQSQNMAILMAFDLKEVIARGLAKITNCTSAT